MYCYNCMAAIRDDSRVCPFCGHSTQVEPIAHHLKQGTVLNGKYLIGNALGEGGFGITYIGFDLNLQLPIAVKEFFPSGCANRNNAVSNRVTLNYRNNGEYFKNGREQFLREAQNIAKFSKEDGIVDVRDYFTENETAYIVMEYLKGDTLAQYLRRCGVIGAEETFTMLLPVMRSLEKMHKKGIIHRDISPDNIMFTEDHHVRLMDFGAARYYTASEKKTMSVMLKPGYAPFEQYSAHGHQGPWTDIYGLCATIYKCITGKTPVDSLARCTDDTLQRPSALGYPISPALETVLMLGLELYPENRCNNMTELIRMVETALHHAESIPRLNPAYDADRTSLADDTPTALRKKTYGDSRIYNGYTPETAAPERGAPPQRKSRAGVIAALIIACLLLIAGAAVFLMFRFGVFDSHQTLPQSTEAPAATAAAAEETDAPEDGDGDVVVMSNVTGKKFTDAAAELESKGLVVEHTEEESSEVAEGYVIRQSIDPDRTLNKGDSVMLYVAKAPATAAPTVRTVETTAPVSSSDVVLYNTLCKEFVTLRSSPSMKASAVDNTKIPKNAAVTLTGTLSDSDFIRVSYNGKTGYVLAAFFTASNSSGGRSVKYCIARNYANLRSRPGSDDQYNIAKIYTDSPVQCTGSAEYVKDQKYLQVIYHGQTGYVLDAVFSDTMDGSTYRGD